MPQPKLTTRRAQQLLRTARQRRILVVGDVMLDQFIWGTVSRISPEAPVPILEFQRESFIPGGAANVARNLSALGVTTEIFGLIGHDHAGTQLKELLKKSGTGIRGLISQPERPTSIKTRIVAHQQQVVRVDREVKTECPSPTARRLLAAIEPALLSADALIVGDYGKGVVSQELLDGLKQTCRARGVWLSLDPKPVHALNLSRLSMITPNRKETFALANIQDEHRASDPLKDRDLMRATQSILESLKPAILLTTLGDQGMLLCRQGERPFHIPTVAQEVYDVSGAGDTVIAIFTLAIAAGASPVEAAILSNHAAGIVVGKIGTAAVHEEELLASFNGRITKR